jgi:hypothetical protein
MELVKRRHGKISDISRNGTVDDKNGRERFVEVSSFHDIHTEVLYVLPGSGLQQIWSRARDTFLEGRALSG